jgi:uroporphyrinogen decarboxylase
MRTNVTERYYRFFTGLPVDRCPDQEFGYWPQTIRRWLKEGLNVDLTPEERNQMFCRKVDAWFGFETWHSAHVGLRWHMNPAFEEKVLQRLDGSVILRDTSGAIAQRYTHDQDDSSIPHFIEFPVKTPDDWREMKQRYRPDDAVRAIPATEIEAARAGAAQGRMVCVNAPGPYGVLRSWMGFENLSLAFYEHPDMIHDMVEHLAALTVGQIRKIPADVPIDFVSFWEDMASKNGPFVGPAMFRDFLQPCYHAIMEELRKHGCALGIVDCDGNPHDIVANWLEEGVNIMYPLEVAAGVDPYAWRREFGRGLLLKGGVAKAPLVEGGAAIDRELERLRPLYEQGGFMPHLDHLVPPDIPLKHYQEYLEKKRRFIGRA